MVCPTEIVGIVSVTSPVPVAPVELLHVTFVLVIPDGTRSFTITFTAGSGPLFFI